MSGRLETSLSELYRRVKVLEQRPQGNLGGLAGATISTSETTTSSSWTDLTTGGPEVEVEVSHTGELVVVVTGRLDAGGGICGMGFELSGADTLAASTTRELRTDGLLAASHITYLSGLNPGLITVTSKYHSDGAATATFSYRRLLAIPT